MKFRPLKGTPAARKPSKKSTWGSGFNICSGNKFDDDLAKSQRAAAMARRDFCNKYSGYQRRNCAENS